MPMVNKLLCVLGKYMLWAYRHLELPAFAVDKYEVYTTRIAQCLSLLNNGVCVVCLGPCSYLFLQSVIVVNKIMFITPVNLAWGESFC